MSAVLDHERLDVYQVARELTRAIRRLDAKLRHGRADVRDQILRATTSIPLNIAEACGERSLGRRLYFLRIARSSATELASGLDHMVDMRSLTVEDTAREKALIARVVAMLVGLEAANIASESRARASATTADPRAAKRDAPVGSPVVQADGTVEPNGTVSDRPRSRRQPRTPR